MTIEIEEFVNDGESPTLQDYARRMESIPNIIFTVGLYDKTFYLLNNVQISEFEMRIEQFGSIYRYRGRVGSFQLL